MTRMVTASYETREEAEYAAECLVEVGLVRQEISVLAPQSNGGGFSFSIEPRRRTLSGVGGGSLLGLLIGAACCAALSLMAVAIPGLDDLGIDFATMGPLLSALIGAGAGATVAGVLGGLFGLSRTEHEAVLRDADRFGDYGYVLVGVAVPPEMVRSAVSVLSSAGAHKIVRG